MSKGGYSKIKTPRTTSGRKAKGKALTKLVKERLIHYYGFNPDDIVLPAVSSPGEDILFSPFVRTYFPYSIECKNQEISKTLFGWYEQAKNNAGNYEPVVVFKKNRCNPLVMIDLEHFLTLTKRNK